MNSDNQIFSFSRYGLCLKHYVGENWKRLALQALLVITTLMVMACIIGRLNFYQYERPWNDYHASGYFDPVLSVELGTFTFLFFVLGAASVSLMFWEAATKEGRMKVLVSPFSQAEKFWSRFTVYFFGFIVVFFIGVLVGDAARILVTKCFSDFAPWTQSITAYLNLLDMSRDALIAMNIFLMMFLFTMSWFILGAVVWPKNAFIKTFATLVLLTIVMVIISSISTAMFLSEGTWMPRFISKEDVDTCSVLWRMWTLTVVASSIPCAVAYWRFKDMELINRW